MIFNFLLFHITYSKKSFWKPTIIFIIIILQQENKDPN